MASELPALDLLALQAAAGDHPESQAAVADFHAELSTTPPDPARLKAHAARLQALPALAGPFERWWLNPRVQEFLAELNATGI